MRQGAVDKEETKTVTKPKDTADERVQRENDMLAAQKKSRRSAILIGAIACVAVILVLVGMLIPVIAYMINPYRNYKDVIARFNLSNGMKLEYVIDENLYDTAATNFIFLAVNGFFDNTVFFDAQNGWLRFGGYEDLPKTNSSSDFNRTKHRSDNKTFCDNFKALPTDAFRDDNSLYKFDYKLRADSNGENVNLLNQIGVLAYLYSDSSTEFEFSYKEQAINDIESVDGGTNILEPTMVGHALDGPDGETVKNLIAISNTAATSTLVSSGYKWLAPTPTIYIESVKVYNLDDSKWKTFDFISYMKENDSSNSRRYRSWHLKNP